MEYWLANEDINRTTEKLIGQYHPEIATIQLIILFKTKATKAEQEKQQIITVKKVSPLYYNLIGQKEFIIVISQNEWIELSENEKMISLDSALSRISPEVTDSGEFKTDEQTGNFIFKLREPEINEFLEIIDRYGLDAISTVADKIRAIVMREGREDI